MIRLFCNTSAAIKRATSTSPPLPVRSLRNSAEDTPNASIIAHM